MFSRYSWYGEIFENVKLQFLSQGLGTFMSYKACLAVEDIFLIRLITHYNTVLLANQYSEANIKT